MVRRSDMDGDGRDEIPVLSPWGIGVLEVEGFALTSHALSPNGTRFAGGWLLNTDDNRFDRLADVDGDGRAELLVASRWGVGVLERVGRRLRTKLLHPNGTRFGEWLLNTVNDRIGPTGDLDGDGAEEVVVTSPWGIGVWSLDGDTFTTSAIHRNGTDLGGWVVDTATQRIHLVGDLDGDGRAEVLVTGPDGLAVLRLTDAGLRTAFVLDNGDRAGEWLLDTPVNRFVTLLDVDGDGRQEVVVASPWGLGVLEWEDDRLTSRHMVRNGTRIGGWLVNSLDNRFVPAGDYDGDGADELLVVSPWGIGVIDERAGSLRMSMMAPNGTRFGGWLLNTADNRFGPVGDYDGDGRDELVVSSPWGMAVLNINGASVSPRAMSANGTRFDGGWLLNTDDNRIGVGPELLRLHVKVVREPTIDIVDMVTEMQRVYAQVGIQVEVASTEDLDVAAGLVDINVGPCVLGSVTAEQAALFANRDNAPTTDVVVYFVRSTVPPFNGCASSPPGQPGSVVARGASLWTLGHEVGHNLTLRHVTGSDRLMTGGGTGNITNAPPDIAPGEANTIKAQLLTHPV